MKTNDQPIAGKIWTFRMSPWFTYVFAIAITLGTLLLRIQFNSIFGTQLFLILLILPIILSAYVGGLSAGLLATLTAAFSSDYFLISPTISLQIAEIHDTIQWLVLIIGGVLVSVLSESLHRSRERVERSIIERKQVEEILRESEKKLQARERILKLFVEYAPAAIAMFDHDMKYIAASQRYAIDYRLPDNNVIGRSHYEVFPEIPERWKEIHRHCLAGATEKAEEDPFPRADGSLDWIQWEIRPWYEESGKIGGIILFSEVITERKQAETALHESEQRFSTAFHASPASQVIVAIADGRLIDLNDAFCRMTGYKRDEIINHTITELNLWTNPKSREAIFQTMMSDGHVREVEVEYRTLSGEVRTLLASLEPIEVKGTQCFIATALDITERKRADDIVRTSKAKLDAALFSMTDAVFISDIEGNFIEFNEAFATFHKFKNKDECAKTLAEYPDFLEVFMDTGEPAPLEMWAVPRALRGEIGINVEYSLRRKDTGETWVGSYSFAPIRDKDGTIVGSVVVGRDITASKQAMEKLRESEERFRQLADHLEEAFWITSVDHSHEVYISPAAEKIWKVPLEKLMKTNAFTEQVLPEDLPGVQEMLKKQERGERTEMEYRIRQPDGPIRWIWDRSFPIFDESGNLVNSAGISTDITERKLAEKQIQLQLQRMRALSEIDRAINSSLDMRLSLEILLNEVLSQLGVDAASVLLFNTANQSLEYMAGKGFYVPDNHQWRIRLGEEGAGRVGLERRILHITNLAEIVNQFKRASFIHDEKFVEYYGMPLVAKGMLKGVLEVFHRSPLNSDPEWVDYLKTLGGQAAIAIDNVQLFEGIQRSNLELTTAYDATIRGWSHAMDLRDKETEGHTLRVTDLTLRLAAKAGIGSQEQVHIHRGALLHDIGKLGVPDHILLKPDKLTDEEWIIMRKHPVFAFDMLMPIDYLRPAIDIPYCHHEKWDGSGYPRGLKGEQIPLAARFFAVVDVWDALRSDRPYRPGWTYEKTRAYIIEQSGKHFDPRAVEAFIKLLDESPDIQ